MLQLEHTLATALSAPLLRTPRLSRSLPTARQQACWQPMVRLLRVAARWHLARLTQGTAAALVPLVAQGWGTRVMACLVVPCDGAEAGAFPVAEAACLVAPCVEGPCGHVVVASYAWVVGASLAWAARMVVAACRKGAGPQGRGTRVGHMAWAVASLVLVACLAAAYQRAVGACHTVLPWVGVGAARPHRCPRAPSCWAARRRHPRHQMHRLASCLAAHPPCQRSQCPLSLALAWPWAPLSALSCALGSNV
mmetsp:Transcript_12276/g.29983  ORF Transcript_12276/g.29983 Transcript_12276/m.29983 type:complete len:251 (-) Transcript_12276:262-1014(-)